MPKFIREAGGGGAPALTGNRLLTTIITPGWGSSGYYSPEVLAQAAEAKVFPKGTHMHLDHASEADSYDRPEGSLKTLSGVLLEDARWEPNWVDPKTGTAGRLVAESRPVGPWKQTLVEAGEALYEAIGVSIRAAADFVLGEAEGRRGKIVEALQPHIFNSVDFVTHAGRGGSFMVLESAADAVKEARNVGQWMEARIHSMFTNIGDEFYGEGKLTREERIALSGALGDALVAFTAAIEAGAPQLYTRDLWDEPEAAGNAAENAPQDSPADPAGANQNQEEANMATIDDAELAQLREDASRAAALEADLAARDEADQARQAAEALATRRTEVTAIVSESFGAVAAPRTQAAIVAEALAAEATDEDVRTAAQEAAAELAVAAGAGKVQGLGAPAAEAAAGAAPKDYKAATLAVLNGEEA